MRVALLIATPLLVLTHFIFLPDQFDALITWAASIRQ